MPQDKSESDGNTSSDPPPDKDGDDVEFVEVDPTGRYGRYDDVLGKGAFKTVYRAFDEVDGIEVAWNQVKVQDVLQSPEDLERLYSEVHLLKTLKHKNIIKFYNSWVDTKTKNVNFITEIFTSGTLRQYRKKHKHVDIKAVKNWSRQILRGLLYLHSHDPPIIHRDLKCDNIFVNGNQGEVKIGDLGLAAILRQAHAAHSVIGTPEFMAPELYEEEYNELVDIYSFGMCLLEMVTFEYPYSECINAAQIYKKVSSGKKPAALEKVKDPDVRAFVEKCLATASRRLPARELLMDPFLQCEGDRETIECVPAITLSKTRTDDFEELGVICENQVPLPMSGTRYPNQKIENDKKAGTNRGDYRSVVACGSKRMPPLSVGRRSDDEDDPSGSSRFDTEKYSKAFSTADRARRSSRDFRVKGKRKDDDTIFLRLRIADHDGHSRNIHFPFDIEGDTAMCVASEMVAELDLSDQDVTTIAEMIDAEILALVPEWQPGVAVDEAGDGETGYATLPTDSEPITISSEDSVLEALASSWKLRSVSPRISSLVVTSPPRTVEGTMHGRFEEVTYPPRTEQSRRGSEAPVIFTSESSDERDENYDRDEWDAGRSKSEASDSGSLTRQSVASSSIRAGHREARGSGTGSFNELVERRRSAGTTKYTHEPWEGLGGDHNRFDSSNQDELSEGEGEDDDEAVQRELESLALRQQGELQEMQRRHELALHAIKKRQRQKNSFGEHGGPISPESQYTNSSYGGLYHSERRSFQGAQPRSTSSTETHSKHSADKRNADKRNGTLPLKQAENLSRLASWEPKYPNPDVGVVDAPKGYGLGHNLQGHIIQQPTSDRKLGRTFSGPSDAEASQHGKRKERHNYFEPTVSSGNHRAIGRGK